MDNNELIQRCSNKLKSLSGQVASEDRKDAMEEFRISYVTVWRYLQGDVKNIDLGVKLYEFIHGRIEARKRVLSA